MHPIVCLNQIINKLSIYTTIFAIFIDDQRYMFQPISGSSSGVIGTRFVSIWTASLDNMHS
jgi:hypothetical protein